MNTTNTIKNFSDLIHFKPSVNFQNFQYERIKEKYELAIEGFYINYKNEKKPINKNYKNLIITQYNQMNNLNKKEAKLDYYNEFIVSYNSHINLLNKQCNVHLNSAIYLFKKINIDFKKIPYKAALINQLLNYKNKHNINLKISDMINSLISYFNNIKLKFKIYFKDSIDFITTVEYLYYKYITSVVVGS